MASQLEKEFALMWGHVGGPKLTSELAFHPSRKWRFDFACEESKVAIEIEGGVWSKGRHTRGSGFIADAEKYNTANLHGWTVFRLAKGMITVRACADIADFIRGRLDKPSVTREALRHLRTVLDTDDGQDFKEARKWLDGLN